MAADIAGLISRNTRVTVAGRTYYIAGIQSERKDGKGLVILILSEDEVE
jgi:hypothetical protein